jgi:hypothetical protein
MKKKDEIHWGMLWQGQDKNDTIEDVLKGAVERFLEKYFCLPEVIYVNPGIELKSYGAIPVFGDVQMYCGSMVTLMIPGSVEIEK